MNKHHALLRQHILKAMSPNILLKARHSQCARLVLFVSAWRAGVTFFSDQGFLGAK